MIVTFSLSMINIIIKLSSSQCLKGSQPEPQNSIYSLGLVSQLRGKFMDFHCWHQTLLVWWKILLRYKIWQFCVWWKINDVHRDETGGDVCAFSSICDNYSPVRKSLKIHPFITLSTHHFRSQCTRERVRVPVITHVYIWIKLKPLFRDFNSTLSSIPVPAMRNGVAVAANTTKSSKNIRERERDVWGAQPTMKNVVLVFLFYVRQSFNNHKHVVVV